MKKSSFIAILTIALACLATDSLHADVFNFNTGQAGIGGADPVYAGSFGTAYGVNPVLFGAPNNWVTPAAGSNWISQHTDAGHTNTVDGVAANPAIAASTFTYTASFNLGAGLNLASASFSAFQIAVDNAVIVRLNGTQVAQINTVPLDSSNTAAFNTLADGGANALHNFNLNGFLGSLVLGLNNLTFTVFNTPASQTPEGLLVTGSLTVNPTDIPGIVPEPASMIAWVLVGGIGAALGYRRRRNVS